MRKLYLGIAVASAITVGQVAWACEKPQVSGYDYIYCLKDGLSVTKKDGKYGFIDKTGQVIIPFVYSNAGDFDNESGLAIVTKDKDTDNGGYGFINKTGKVVIPLQYGTNHETDNAFASFSEGLVALSEKGKFGYFDTKGKLVIPFKYIQAQDFNNGLAVVALEKNDGYKYGFIDTKGKEVIPIKYDYIESNFFLDDNKTRVGLNDEYFYIDRKGNRLPN